MNKKLFVYSFLLIISFSLVGCFTEQELIEGINSFFGNPHYTILTQSDINSYRLSPNQLQSLQYEVACYEGTYEYFSITVPASSSSSFSNNISTDDHKLSGGFKSSTKSDYIKVQSGTSGIIKSIEKVGDSYDITLDIGANILIRFHATSDWDIESFKQDKAYKVYSCTVNGVEAFADFHVSYFGLWYKGRLKDTEKRESNIRTAPGKSW